MPKGAVVGFTNGFTAASLFFGAIAGVVGSSSFLEAYCGGVCREGGVSLGGGSQSWVICYQSVSICFSQKHTTINVTYSGFFAILHVRWEAWGRGRGRATSSGQERVFNDPPAPVVFV